MKYRYLYQTSANENRDGWISAKNRAEAYATLRKQGIRPYRLIGDDPVGWRPWAAGVAIFLLAAALAVMVEIAWRGETQTISRRCQITGDYDEIARGVATCWEDVFDSPLDQFLSSYAQPGWFALPPDVPESELEHLAQTLDGNPPTVSASDSEAVCQIKRIVAGMRLDMKAYIDSGGKVVDYLAFMETRQDEEIAYRSQAQDSLERTPETMRQAVRANLNLRLRERGLPEL